MTTPLWCLVVVLFMPTLLSFAGGYYRARAFGKPDNKHPRLQAAQLEGAGARAYAAQENAWEAAIGFSAVILIAHVVGVSASEAAPWAIAFVVTRILHPILYIANIDWARSIVFLVGIVCLIRLVVMAASV